MFEMSLADLDAELAVELPERELMHRGLSIRVNVNHSFNSFTANVTANNTATVRDSECVYISQGSAVSISQSS